MKAHRDGTPAANRFTVEAWTLPGLIHLHVVFVIKVATRRVHIAGYALIRTDVG